MSNPYNHIVIVGRLGADPEILILPGKGTKKAVFSICQRKTKQGKEGDVWHRVIAYGSRADVVEKYLRKGRVVIVPGELTYNTWTDNKGVKQSRAEILLDVPGFLDKNTSCGVESESHEDYPNHAGEDLPFE